jgi:tRNA modification GTPase
MTDRLPDDADTIVARATPAGRGGIAVVRVSGPGTRAVAQRLLGGLPAPRVATLTDFMDGAGQALDRGLALFFPGPNSFTGEDVLECHAHGGPVVCEMLIERILGLGARLANPGEFSRRAFLNDKLDLAQAEAIADLIDSGSRAAARAAQRSLRGAFSTAVMALDERVTELRLHVEAAIDFPDEEIDFLAHDALRARLQQVRAEFDHMEAVVHQGCLLRDGVQIVLAGRPNAGKSSLLNALAGYPAAIVTDVPGTTRDLVREQLDLDGLPAHLIDTAGLRASEGKVELEGIRRTREQLAAADHALLIVEATKAASEQVEDLFDELPAHLGYTVVRNKVDLTREPPGRVAGEPNWINVSALTGAGIDALRQHIKTRLGFEDPGEGSVIARQRHLASLRKARLHFDAGCRQLAEHRAGELMADELLQVQNALAEITGEFSSDDLLGRIFASFCIGK